MIVVKHGRRAPLSDQYEPLRAHVEAKLNIRTEAFEPGAMSIVQQIRTIGRGAIALTPDGGQS